MDDTGGTVVVTLVVVDVDAVFGSGAPVESRHPVPGGVNADMLTMGGGRFFDGPDGCVVVVGATGPVVVGPLAVVDVVARCVVVVGSAAVDRCSFNWNPTMMSAETQSPRTTRKGQLGPAPPRVDSLGISFECNSER
jgi:hypothetical protein